MKKNNTMRIASVLLIAVLLTTSIISGTFAKYVVSDERADEARVAIFGVKAVANGTLFAKNYVQVADGNTPDYDGSGKEAGTLTVESSADINEGGDNVVAPGTTNKDENGNGFIFGVIGTPEVAVTIDWDLESATDIWLAKGTYADLTTGDAFDDDILQYAGRDGVTFTLENDYYPIQYTLTHSEDGETWEAVDEVTAVPLYAVVEYLEETFGELESYYAPNTNLGEEIGLYNLTWEWAFDGEQELDGNTFDADTVDKADTLLGDLSADKYGETSLYEDAKWAIYAASEGEDNDLNLAGEYAALTADVRGSHCLTVDFAFSISVTQVD